jgi:superfamily II DNA or RNA helicase
MVEIRPVSDEGTRKKRGRDCHDDDGDGVAAGGGAWEAWATKYGSKLANMIRAALSLFNPTEEGAEPIARGGILVFTQWAAHARSICTAFKCEGVSARVMDGNTATRNAVRRSFENGATKIMVCSADQSVDGLDIPCCDTVFIAHALVGDSAFVRDTEKQVIGRLDRIGQTSDTVRVHHFIAAGTAEENLFTQTRQAQA